MQDVACDLKNKIIDNLHGPLQFHAGPSLSTWYGHEHIGLNKDQFMMAFNFITTVLDMGYYPSPGCKLPLLGALDWATLSSATLAAIGRGYAHSHSEYNEAHLDLIWRTTMDISTDKKDPPFSHMFKQLMATTEHLHTFLTPDNEDAVEWINNLKQKTTFFTNHYSDEV